MSKLPLPNGKFNVILADPPWRFEPRSRKTGLSRAADNHYSTDTVEDICAIPVSRSWPRIGTSRGGAVMKRAKTKDPRVLVALGVRLLEAKRTLSTADFEALKLSEMRTSTRSLSGDADHR